MAYEKRTKKRLKCFEKQVTRSSQRTAVQGNSETLPKDQTFQKLVYKINTNLSRKIASKDYDDSFNDIETFGFCVLEGVLFAWENTSIR